MLTIVLTISALAAAALVFAAAEIWGGRAKDDLESWRDRLPAFFRLTRPLAMVVLPQVRARMAPATREKTRRRLDAGGLGYALQPDEFYATRIVMAVIGLALCVYLHLMLAMSIGGSATMIAIVLCLSYTYPDIWLRDRTLRRQRIIHKQFPFFLELLVLSMRAGLSFSAALAHAVEQMAEGPVQDEFERVIRDTRAGLSRRQALEDLSERANLSAVTSFVAVVNQAEEAGGKLSAVLIEQAEQRRKERFLRAEKLANEAPVKMLFPLVVLLFPITMIVVLFPVAVKVYESGGLAFFGG